MKRRDTKITDKMRLDWLDTAYHKARGGIVHYIPLNRGYLNARQAIDQAMKSEQKKKRKCLKS